MQVEAFLEADRYTYTGWPRPGIDHHGSYGNEIGHQDRYMEALRIRGAFLIRSSSSGTFCCPINSVTESF